MTKKTKSLWSEIKPGDMTLENLQPAERTLAAVYACIWNAREEFAKEHDGKKNPLLEGFGAWASSALTAVRKAMTLTDAYAEIARDGET